VNDQIEEESEFPQELIEEKEEPPEEKVYQSLYKKVMGMSVGEKIKLATTGNKEARNLLLKDANKLVLSAVINSPKMMEDEIIKICQSRNVSDEALRLISAKKELVKKYQIKLGLATNPKTPIPIALKLLNHILEPDLRNISKSKNVPSVVSRTAIKILQDRGKL
jgi:hypothetical protein